MRAAEDAALRFALSQPAPSIIDAAAGTIMSPESRKALIDPIVVWLRASPETLSKRAAGAARRPWLDRGEEWLRTADEERRPLFASVADIVADTDVRQPADVAAEIYQRISELCPELAQN